jgi:transcriptional regulator with XRE-family HTH domain
VSVSEVEPVVGKPTSRAESRSLSERVRLYVLEQSGNATEVFKVTGVAKTTLGAWLKGEKALTTPVFDRICQAYGIVPTRPDIGLGDSDHVPYAQNILTKNASLADYEKEIIRLRYREKEVVSQRDQAFSLLIKLTESVKSFVNDCNEEDLTGAANETR